jgi:argininosuccinate lyase
MVREAGIPFRAAHQIVGSLVRKAIDEGLGLDKVPLEMIKEVGHEIIGRELILTEKDVKDATDPRVNVERRRSIGGPAPVEVERMIANRLVGLVYSKKRRDKRLEKYEIAKVKVEKEINRLLG